MPRKRQETLRHIEDTVAQSGKSTLDLLRYAQSQRIGLRAYDAAVRAGLARHEVEVLRPRWLANAPLDGSDPDIAEHVSAR